LVVFSGCADPEATIFVSSQVDRPLLFRVVTTTVKKDFLVPGWAFGNLITVPSPIEGEILVLDVSTCQVLTRGVLPQQSAAVGVVYPNSIGPEISLSIAAKRVAHTADQFDEDERCSEQH
jgi:hypothetical protein